MDEKQKFIERWEQFLAECFPEIPEQEQKQMVKDLADGNFGTTKSQETETHA